MKNLNRIIGLIALAVIFSCSISNTTGPGDALANQAPEKKAYVCPPCGCDKDNEVFDKPGPCPSCGMPLVDKDSSNKRPAANRPPITRKNVAILIFDGVEIIDYTGPWEVFGGAGFNVYTVAEKTDPITTAMGMKVIPNYTFENNPRPDILLVPGGGVIATQKNPTALRWVQESAGKAEVVLSVCNGAYILAKAGLLYGLKATTTARLIDGLALAAPNITVVRDQRFVDNGKIITTGGLSAGIDGALHVVSRMLGPGRAQQVALGLEYNWDPEAGFARAALADKYLQFASKADIDGELLSTQGGRDHWESQWRVKSESTAADLFEKVNKTIATEGKWLRQDSGKINDPAKSLWKFTDENGKTWSGVASVQPLPVEQNQFMVSVKIARNDAGK